MLQRMDNYHTFGQFVVHELMHLESTWDSEPTIIDKRLPQMPYHIAYGPPRVYKLAHGSPSQQEGYGAASSSIHTCPPWTGAGGLGRARRGGSRRGVAGRRLAGRARVSVRTGKDPARLPVAGRFHPPADRTRRVFKLIEAIDRDCRLASEFKS